MAHKIILFLIVFGSFQIRAQSTTVMSFNIRYDNPNDKENWWQNRKDELVKLVEYYHPDFLGIQEGLNNQVEFLGEKTSSYNYIGVGRDDGNKKGEYAAIFYDSTKFELMEEHTFWLSETPEKVSVGWDASMERICTYGKFKEMRTNDSIYVFNAHFDHIGSEAREMSAKLILHKIKERNLDKIHVVLMGDFNSEPKSKAIKILKDILDDGFEASKSKFYGPLGTFNSFKPAMMVSKRIDYIFTKNMDVIKYRHVDDRRMNNLCISDHFPVFVEIKMISNK